MSKFVNREHMKKYREKMNEINKRFAKANKENNTKELERIHEMQKKEILPLTGKVMKEQFKMMALVIVLFSIALYLLPYVDTTNRDDIKFSLEENKPIKLDNEGVWDINIEKGGKPAGSLRIGVGKEGEELKNETEVDGVLFYVDKKVYLQGEEVELKYKGEVKNNYTIDYDRGTRVSIYLGLPFLNIIEGSYGVFIFFVIIFGLIASFIENQIKKLRKKEEKE